MELIIVESPHKAVTISKYLGRGYKVIASKGHVRDLPTNRMAVDVNNNFTPEYVINPDKESVIEMINKEVAKADKVYLAGDPDREGEAISWHIAEVCGIKGDNIRIEFNEISKRAVLKAIQSPRAINMDLVDAQQARRVLDRLVGYELSPIISKLIQPGLSAGRVQSVALKMIVDREKEIRNFKPEEYWPIIAQISKQEKAKAQKCELVSLDGKKLKVTTKEMAEKVINESKAGDWSVKDVKRSISYSKAPAPFTTSTMQQEAISKLNFSAAQVTKCAQSLYEGAEIKGMGQTALVTYIRTDSVRVSYEAQQEALAFIGKNFGADYVPQKPNYFATKSDAQDAHEAIRPINVELTPESIKDKMARDEWRLYNLIYNRFLASQMAAATYDTLEVSISSDYMGKDYGYKLKGKTCSFKGYTAAYSTEEKDNAKELPNFEKGEKLICQDVTGEQKFTKPSPRYTDGTVIKAMEDNGIGRPSTYEKTVSVLVLRKYVEKIKNAETKKMELVPTELGEKVVEKLVEGFPKIMDTKFTADMEAKLDDVAEGKEKWHQLLQDFYPEFHRQVISVKIGGKKDPAQESDVICDKCGARMIIKQGKFGKFLACPNFPRCQNTKPFEEPVAKCPQCGRPVYQRTAKSGKPYYTCSGYPICKFMSWDLPAPVLCPKCNSVMKMTKDREGHTKYICTNRACKTQVVPNNEN